MNKIYLWLIFVSVIVAGFMFSNFFVHAQEKIAETQWEYKIVYAKNQDSMKRQVKQDQPVLNALGMQGWELVTMQYSNYYFKRKIKK